MIEIKNVSKTYPGGIKANDNISFTVNNGETVALVGPNGSGKTTLIRQILGVISPGEGRILIDGRYGAPDNTAYVPQMPALYPALTVREHLLVTMKYLGIPKREAGERIVRTLERTGLSDISSQPAYTLSGGQRKLLSFASLLVQEAENLVMDEVTSAVDVVTKELVWRLVEEERARGCAILLSSHDISEVRKLSTKLVVLKRGSVIFSGLPEEVQNEYCHCTLRTDKREQTVKVLESLECSYTCENGVFSVVTGNLSSMISLLDCLSASVTITVLKCEHPAFYDGLISILKKEAE